MSIGPNGNTSRGRTWKTAFPALTDAHPVVGVSWTDATNFCAWLTDREHAARSLAPNQRYALPTAAQWSAMAGPVPYPWGSNYPPTPTQANFAGQELAAHPDWPVGWRQLLFDFPSGASAFLAPAGSGAPNARGFRDLGGNAAEWCADDYRSSMNDLNSWSVPSARLRDDQGGHHYRVVRGGSWFDHNDPDLLRTSTHWAETPDTRNDRIGFRIVIVESP